MAASLVCLVFLCATHAVANGVARDEVATSLSLKSTITTRLTALEAEMKTVVQETIEDILRHLDELESKQAQTQKDEPQGRPTAAQTQKDEPRGTPTAAQTQKDEPQGRPTAAQTQKDEPRGTPTAAQTQKDEPQGRPTAAQTQKDEPRGTPTAAQTQKDEPQGRPTAAQTQKDEPRGTPTAAQTQKDEPRGRPTAAQTQKDEPQGRPTAAQTQKDEPRGTPTAAQTQKDEPQMRPTAAQTQKDEPQGRPTAAQTQKDEPRGTPTAAQTQKDEPQMRPTAAQTQKDEPQRTPTAAQTQKDEPQGRPTAAQKKPKFESYQRDAVTGGTEEQTKKEEFQRTATKVPVTESEKVVAAGCGAPPPRGGTTFTQTKRTAVYKCKPKHRNIGGKKTSSVCDTASGEWSQVDIFCTNFTTCSKIVKGRSVYGGTVSTTKSGRTCQRWDQQKPNRHWFLTNESFKTTTGLGRETRRDAANYCRDPGVMVADKSVWCYTTDPKVRSEECAVPECQVPK
ncbi:trans-Golgi network integral membrane protein 2-like isoform X2 [Haliotis rufescens]|uniref:trans-Golgi network integral membrane protein 2-like isoform X2 n=1 Tax=Haliotis rufescens TaxID=6454 RepID=UPI00201ED5CC|nr:trans-Golgi network integral membrane protein 2-like isoform X2 [Haliotis rufescens]